MSPYVFFPFQFTLTSPIANVSDFSISIWYHGKDQAKSGTNIRGLVQVSGTDIGLGFNLRDDALQFWHDDDDVGIYVHELSGRKACFYYE